MAGAGLWSGSAGHAGAGLEFAALWAMPAVARGTVRGDGAEAGDTLRRLTRGMREHGKFGRVRRAPTGLLAVVGQVSEVYDSVRGRVNHVLNPTAFGFRLHVDIAASLRRPGNGFVITFRF